MSDAPKGSRKAYNAAYRLANLDRIKAREAEYYRTNSAHILAAKKTATRQAREMSPVEAARVALRKAQSDTRKARANERAVQHAWEALTLGAKAARKRAVDRDRARRNYAADPAYRNAVVARRNAAQSARVPPWRSELCALVEMEAYDVAARRASSFGAWHVDHMLPLQSRKVSGLHVWNNLQVIPQELNLAKGNKLQLTQPLEWLRHV